MQNKPNLPDTQMNLSIFSQMAYEYKSNWTLGQNKPNSNPIKPNFQKAKMNVNSLITKDYRKKDAFAVQKNKPNSNPIQTQFKPNQTQFPSRNAKNALSTCLPKAPLRRHRQSYATWNLLLRPD